MINFIGSVVMLVLLTIAPYLVIGVAVLVLIGSIARDKLSTTPRHNPTLEELPAGETIEFIVTSFSGLGTAIVISIGTIGLLVLVGYLINL